MSLMQEKANSEPLPGVFSNCDSRYVFDEVNKRVISSQSRSLWRRIEKELNVAGVNGVGTYLESSFLEIAQKLRTDIKRQKEAIEK